MHKPSDDPFLDPETMYKELTPPGPILSPEELRAILDEPATGDAIDPDHYKVGGIETIDYMRAKSTPEEFEAQRLVLHKEAAEVLGVEWEEYCEMNNLVV